jgi:hypothetical protein
MDRTRRQATFNKQLQAQGLSPSSDSVPAGSRDAA